MGSPIQRLAAAEAVVGALSAGAIAHVGLHVGAVFHNYNSNLFLPPHH